MFDNFTSGPPKHLYRGELGAEIVILSLSDIRIAQCLDREESIETADGPVTGRVGDFVVTAGTERYPIPATIYYGTYEVLGHAGLRFVGRRLLHARRAWPAISDVEFDYGPGRGLVGAPKGAWVYQSDENDFGLINPDVQKQAHVVVGTATELAAQNWAERFRRTVSWIALLPPFLSLVALLA